MLNNNGDLNMTLPHMVAAGQFPGALEWRKFGAGTVTTSWSTVYSAGANPGLYQYMSAPEKVSVASTDTDDALGGTGGEFVSIEGLDEDLNMLSEIILLDGQTPVESTYVYIRVMRVENVSTQDIQGQCYVGPSSASWLGGEPDHILGHINDGYNQSQLALYTVPKEYTLMVDNFVVTTAAKEGEVGVYIRGTGLLDLPLTVFANKVPFEIAGAIVISTAHHPFMIPSGAEFEIRARASQASMRVTANMTGILMPNRYFPKHS